MGTSLRLCVHGVYSYISRPIHNRPCKDIMHLLTTLVYPLPMQKNGSLGMRLCTHHIHFCMCYMLTNTPSDWKSMHAVMKGWTHCFHGNNHCLISRSSHHTLSCIPSTAGRLGVTEKCCDFSHLQYSIASFLGLPTIHFHCFTFPVLPGRLGGTESDFSHRSTGSLGKGRVPSVCVGNATGTVCSVCGRMCAQVGGQPRLVL